MNTLIRAALRSLFQRPVLLFLSLLIISSFIIERTSAQPQLYVAQESGLQGSTPAFIFDWVFYVDQPYTLRVWIGNREENSNTNVNITIKIQGDNLKVTPNESENVVFNLMNDFIQYDFQVRFTEEGSHAISIELFYQGQKIHFSTIHAKVVSSNNMITLINYFPTALVTTMAVAFGIISLEKDKYKQDEASTLAFATFCGIFIGFMLGWYYLSIVSFDSIKFLLIIVFLADLYGWLVIKNFNSTPVRFAHILIWLPLVFSWLNIPAIAPLTLPEFFWQIIQALTAALIAYLIDKILKKR